jgi:hypothetical protein
MRSEVIGKGCTQDGAVLLKLAMNRSFFPAIYLVYKHTFCFEARRWCFSEITGKYRCFLSLDRLLHFVVTLNFKDRGIYGVIHGYLRIGMQS